MRRVTIELVCLVDGEVLVPAVTLSGLLRHVSEEVGTWSGRAADPATLLEVKEMMDSLADRIDVDCMALVSELDED
ncbi:hypothetical protein [Streptacidiphilus neutrinimicus]|uniref:hypothetical protein n=1 Tax=Streptacidiphilus neutrinimicus TaxID=105420 RepID=UPI000A4AF13A|nr:hypothetical protein [Streptacidiphilus neutrinimicus]